MKKYIYIFLFINLIIWASCSSPNSKGDITSSPNSKADTTCIQDCQKWCALGCYATVGDAKCIYLADRSMPCCEAKSQGLSALEFSQQVEENNYKQCDIKSSK